MPNAPLTPTALETADLMFGCFKRMGRLVDVELGGLGLSLSRMKLLTELSRNGPCQQTTLANTFGLAPRTVTELLDTLERDGLVERRTDPADRRARQVHLTPAGQEAQLQAVAIRQRAIDRLLGTLTDPQRAGLNETMRAIKVELDKIDADNGSVGGVADPSCAP